MKTIYQSFWGFLLVTHISLLAAMDAPSLHHEQTCHQLCNTLITQDEQLFPVVNSSQQTEFDEEKSVMSSVTTSTQHDFIEYSFPAHNSLSSISAMVSNLVRRINTLEGAVAQKDHQINELQAKVADFEETRKLYSGVYKELPCIVRSMHVFNDDIHYLNERVSYQKSFIINQAAIVEQNQQHLAEFIHQHKTEIEKVENQICKQSCRQETIESKLKKLCEIETQGLQSNQTRLEKELKANKASMKALAAINSQKQACGKKRAIARTTNLSEVDQNFDLMVDIDLESLDGFIPETQEVFVPSHSALVSVSSQESSNSNQSTPLHVAKRTRLASK